MDFSELGRNILALKKDAITFICSLDRSSYEKESSDETIKSKIKSWVNKKKKRKSEFIYLVSKLYNLGEIENKNLTKFMVQDNDAIKTAKLLLKEKFDFEFENEQLVETLDTPEGYAIDTTNFESYAINEESNIRYFIFGVQSTNKQTGFQSDVPTYSNIYRYHLIKLYKNENYLEVKGGKYGYKKITRKIKKNNDSVSSNYNIEKSVLDKNFFTNLLKSINFRVLGLKYGSRRDLSLNIYSSEKDIGSVSNSFIIFSDEIDILNFNELQLEYTDTKNGSIKCELKLDPNYSAGYYELKLYSNSDTEHRNLIKKKILEQFNVKVDTKYSLYQGYYLMKLFTNNRKFWWERINNSPLDFKRVISTLTSMELIAEHKKSVRLYVGGLANYLYSAIEKIKIYKRDDFAIEEVFLEDKIVRFHGYLTEKNSNNKKLFSMAISFNNDMASSISYTDIDWYKLLNTNLKDEEEKQELLSYFLNKVKFQNLIETSFFNNKSIESYRLLSDIKNTLHPHKDATLRGKIFEKAVNDLLLGIYPHYLPLGKDEQADGLLYLRKEKSLIVIDAKSKKKIDSDDIDELIRYLKKDYFNKEIIPYEDKIGLYIFDNKLIESLNLKTAKKRIDEEKENASYLSVGFLIQYFYFLRENLDEILLKPSILESCSEEILNLIEKNNFIKLGTKLEGDLTSKKNTNKVIEIVLKNENICLREIRKSITHSIPITKEIKSYDEDRK